MPFAECTAEVHMDLHDWDRTVLKSPQRRQKSFKEELEKLWSGPLTDESADGQRHLQIEIEETH